MKTRRIKAHRPKDFQSLVIPIRRGGRELPNQGTKVESKHTSQTKNQHRLNGFFVPQNDSDIFNFRTPIEL